MSSEKPRLRPISEVGEWAESTDKEMEEGKLTNVADEWWGGAVEEGELIAAGIVLWVGSA